MLSSVLENRESFNQLGVTIEHNLISTAKKLVFSFRARKYSSYSSYNMYTICVSWPNLFSILPLQLPECQQEARPIH